MSTRKIELSVGAIKIGDKHDIFTEEEIDNINNKIPELDERVGVIEDEIDEINSSLDDMESKKANKSDVGSPLIASNVNEMTDKTRVYVNTTDGNWYSWNGTSWVKGGVYQSNGITNYSISPIKTLFFEDSKNLCREVKHGKANTLSGEITLHDTECYTNNIYSNADKITVKNFTSENNMGCCLLFYKNDGTFLGTTQWGTVGALKTGTFTNQYSTDTGYFIFYTNMNIENHRLMIVNGEHTTLDWVEPFKLKETYIKEHLTDIKEHLTDIDNNLDKKFENELFKTSDSSSIAVIENYSNISININGEENKYDGWYTSDFIECIGIDKIKLTDVPFYEQYTSVTINAISFYDKDKKFIKGFGGFTGGYTNPCGYYTETVINPSNAHYYRVSKMNDKKGIIEIVNSKYDILTRIENLEETNNPLNVLCIGDSLTEGDYGSEPAGTKDVREKNYPYFMNKVTGWNVTNKGKCGLNSKQYWNGFIKWGIDFNNNYDVVIIMLGTNGGMTDTIEIDTNGNSYEDYADNGTGSYCKIIEYVMEKTKGKAQIFLCTCPYVDNDKRPTYVNAVNNANIVIPKIAEKYNLPLIDVSKKLGLNKLNSNIYQPIDGLHFGEFGYERLGTFITNNIKSMSSY